HLAFTHAGVGQINLHHTLLRQLTQPPEDEAVADQCVFLVCPIDTAAYGVAAHGVTYDSCGHLPIVVHRPENPGVVGLDRPSLDSPCSVVAKRIVTALGTGARPCSAEFLPFHLTHEPPSAIKPRELLRPKNADAGCPIGRQWRVIRWLNFHHPDLPLAA